jgi:hypothetical protein
VKADYYKIVQVLMVVQLIQKVIVIAIKITEELK